MFLTPLKGCTVLCIYAFSPTPVSRNAFLDFYLCYVGMGLRGVGRDVNVHLRLRTTFMLRVGWGWVGLAAEETDVPEPARVFEACCWGEKNAPRPSNVLALAESEISRVISQMRRTCWVL